MSELVRLDTGEKREQRVVVVLLDGSGSHIN